ncbi:Cryparin [Dactylellina cionopaga]|nr:Cryparin [Dactylellina cionopaga]
MKLLPIAAILFVGAFAAPLLSESQVLHRRGAACPDVLYSVPTCCSADVLGLADLSCSTPGSASSGSDLKSSCGGQGKAAKCCTLDLLETGVLCSDPVGA